MYDKKFEISPLEVDIDIHNHTKGSDGKQRPFRLLLRASNKGKNIVAISDHDSIKGYELLEKDLYAVVQTIKQDKSYNPEKIIKILEKIKLLGAVELITSYKGTIIEVLAYNFDIQKMKEEIQKLKTTVKKQPEEVLYDGFNKIIDENNFTFNRNKLEEAYKKIKEEKEGRLLDPFFEELISHEENRHLLEYKENNEIKIANTLKLFINKHLYNQKSMFFIDMSETRPTYQDTINAIHNTGGYAILAHPR